MRPRVFISCPLALLLSCSFAGAARAAWVHDLDPFLIQFPKSFPIAGIRWYGLSYLAGFVIAWLLIRRVLRVGTQPEATLDATGTRRLEPQRAADLVINLAIGIVVGGRLGYVLFYRPELFVEFTSSPPFWGALAINKGGMASHGGMVGGTLAVYYFAWRHKVRPLFLGDLFGFGAPLVLFIGRIANLINAELYGLAVVGVLSSVVAAFYYLRIVKLMYFDDAAEALDRNIGGEMKGVLAVCCAVILLFVLIPGPIAQPATAAAAALFGG